MPFSEVRIPAFTLVSSRGPLRWTLPYNIFVVGPGKASDTTVTSALLSVALIALASIAARARFTNLIDRRYSPGRCVGHCRERCDTAGAMTHRGQAHAGSSATEWYVSRWPPAGLVHAVRLARNKNACCLLRRRIVPRARKAMRPFARVVMLCNWATEMTSGGRGVCSVGESHG